MSKKLNLTRCTSIGLKQNAKARGPKMEQTKTTGNVPEKKFSTGVISATVWRNVGTGKNGAVEYNTVTLQRRYTDKDGKWKSTSSLRVNDLPKATLVLQKAYEYLVLKEDQGTPGGSVGMHNDDIIEEEIVM